MDELTKDLYRTLFLLSFTTETREDFQSWFANLLQQGHVGDFQPIRLAGPHGDGGCDGFLRSSGTVFQVYAPREITPAVLQKKIVSDFEKARASLGDLMKRWVLVHNEPDGRLDLKTVKLLASMRESNPGVEIDWWGKEELWREVEQFAEATLRRLFPDAARLGSRELVRPAVTQGDSTTLPVAAIANTGVSDSTGPDSPDSAAVHRILREQIDAQLGMVRDLVDHEGQALWESIRRHIAAMSFPAAQAAGHDLRKWLASKGTRASSTVRGRTFALLADLELMAAPDEGPPGEATRRARDDYALARDAFGKDLSAENAERLTCLTAKIDAVEGDPGGALKQLAGLEGPGAVLIRLALLIDQRNWPSASEYLIDRSLHERWCDLAVIVHLRAENHAQAKQIVEWARARDEVTYHRTLLAFARALTLLVQEELQGGGRMRYQPADGARRDRLTEALARLQPIVAGPEATGQVRTGLEAEGLATAITITWLLRSPQQCRRYGKLLESYRPCHFALARAAQAGIIEIAPDLPDKLRLEHPDSWEAKVIAASVEGLRLGKGEKASAALPELITAAPTDDLKENLCEVLSEITGFETSENAEHISAFIEGQLGAGHRLPRLRRAAELLSKNELLAGAALLEELRDDADPLWWQILGKLKQARGDKNGAAEAILKAAGLMTRVEVFILAAHLADSAERPDLLEQALGGILALNPEDGRAHYKLGLLYAEQQRFSECERCFRVLRARRPEEPAFGLNLAVCLRNDGRANEALTILDELCQSHESDVRPFLMRSRVLQEIGQVDRAFQVLHEPRERFWAEPDFLLAYTHLGYASGHDDDGHQAFARLLELRERGEVPPDRLWSLSLDEMVELFKKHNQVLRDANEAYLSGRLPWLCVEQVERRAAYLGWRTRTQELVLPDPPQLRASYCIYSTNRFTVGKGPQGRCWLTEIDCPPAGTELVADLTALITLHRLGLLDKASRYFGRILVPTTYISWMNEDRTRLPAHQPSVISADRAIDESVKAGRIKIVEAGKPEPFEGMAWVLEYGEPEAPAYGLADLFQWLHDSGKLSASELKRARAFLHKGSRGDVPSLAESSKRGVVTDPATLKTIADTGLLSIVMAAARLHLTNEGLDEVRGELRWDGLRREVLGWHTDLLHLLEDEPFARVAFPPRSTEKQDEDTPEVYTLDAARVAQLRGVPLFVDDRFCQMLAFNARPEDAFAAFGSDALVTGLLATGAISAFDAAQAFVQLMRWRYRFLLPQAEILVEMASEYRHHPPGAQLVEAAQYLHDCMRDPGLFSGPEATEPPMPMAGRYWMAWVNVVGEFIMGIWRDERFTDDTAKAITRWAVEEFLPASPTNLHPFQHAMLAGMTRRILLGAVMEIATLNITAERTAAGLLAVKEALALADTDYLRLCGDLVDGC